MAIDLEKDIQVTSGVPEAPLLVIHGFDGSGKTTFAAGSANNIFIQTEAGQGILKINTFNFGKDRIATSYSQVLEAIEALQTQDHDYETLVIDSLDHLEPLLWEDLCQKNNWSSIEAPGYGKGYTAASLEWRVLLKKLVKLRNTKGMAVVLIAHCQKSTIDEPGESQITRWDLKLHPKSGAVVSETVDCVFFARHKVKLTTEQQGFGQTKKIGKDTGERIMITEGGPHVNAKNRFKLPKEIPLSWDAFMSAMGESIKPSTEKEKANG